MGIAVTTVAEPGGPTCLESGHSFTLMHGILRRSTVVVHLPLPNWGGLVRNARLLSLRMLLNGRNRTGRLPCPSPEGMTLGCCRRSAVRVLRRGRIRERLI